MRLVVGSVNSIPVITALFYFACICSFFPQVFSYGFIVFSPFLRLPEASVSGCGKDSRS